MVIQMRFKEAEKAFLVVTLLVSRSFKLCHYWMSNNIILNFFCRYFVHTVVAFSGLGFLSLYIAGKLHCFQAQGRGQGWKLCVALIPVTCALALALTRYSDYRHHWQGLLAVFLYTKINLSVWFSTAVLLCHNIWLSIFLLLQTLQLVPC